MFSLVSVMLLATAALAAPGIPSYWDDFHLAHAPVIKAAPVLAPAPWHPPVYAPAPAIIKPVVPVVKTIAPTSYATVTQLHVAHPPVIKVAQPVIKTVVAPQPWWNGWH